MTESFIYDAVRTPRGKGKKDGSLHEVTALELAAQTLKACATATISTRRSSTTSCWAASAGGRAGPDIARSPR